jgi:hypothetical protein
MVIAPIPERLNSGFTVHDRAGSCSRTEGPARVVGGLDAPGVLDMHARRLLVRRPDA